MLHRLGPKILASRFKNWSGRADSNRRLPAPKAGALTRLRHVPMKIGFRFSVFGIN